MSVGGKIKEIRKSKGISQKQLGELLNVTDVMIGQYERGVKNPKISTLRKIASALEVSVVDITGWDFMTNVGPITNEVRAFEAVQAIFGKTVCDILGNLSQLNENGQEKAAAYVSDLLDHPKYMKLPNT